MLRAVLLILIISGCSHVATGAGTGSQPPGVQAAPGSHLAQQPGGYSFKLKLKGDERRHWHETTDGYVVIFQKKNRTWYYALCEKGNLRSSTIQVGKKISPDWPKANQLLSENCY